MFRRWKLSNKDGKPLSVREMLEMHRANAACASCHARMDPLGLSLENFDAIGQWRTTDAGHAIDASGVLLDGTKVNGPRELRQALVAQKTQFAQAVTEKLLTYALGRGLEYYDAPAVRAIDRAAAADGYRWSSLILAIVKSAPFQMRTAGQMRTVGEAKLQSRSKVRRMEDMFVTKKAISRRTMLRGVGTAVALPLLDAMIPAFAPAAATAPVRRFGVVYHPNGVIYDQWLPTGAGAEFELSPTLKGLEALQGPS